MQKVVIPVLAVLIVLAGGGGYVFGLKQGTNQGLMQGIQDKAEVVRELQDLQRKFDDVSRQKDDLLKKGLPDNAPLGAGATDQQQIRDGTRITDIKSLQLALELYFSDHSQYPTVLGQLSPAELKGLPTDPATHQQYYYAPYVSAEGTALSYHLGASLENAEDAHLNSDGDCNSKTGSNCPYKSGYRQDTAFDGSDTAGCNGEPGFHCYDITP
jgi:hypothetical protein